MILAPARSENAEPATGSPRGLRVPVLSCLAFALVLLSFTASAGADQPALPRNADRIVVAADGTGNFTTVQAAVDFAEAHRRQPVVIFIRKGRYEERVRIGREKPQVHLVGEDRKATVIAFLNNNIWCTPYEPANCL